MTRGERVGLRMSQAVAQILGVLARYDEREPVPGPTSGASPVDLVGPFVALLARIRRPRRLVEIGASYGSRTVWLALGAQPHGSEIHAIEREVERAATAGQLLADAGFVQQLHIWQGDPREVLSWLEGPFDLAYLAARSADYVACFGQLRRKLSQGALLVAESGLSRPDGLIGYLDVLEADRRWVTVAVAAGGGLEVSYRVRHEVPAISDPIARLLFILAGAANPGKIAVAGPLANSRHEALAAAARELGDVPLIRGAMLPDPDPSLFVVADRGDIDPEAVYLPSGSVLVSIGELEPGGRYDAATVPVGTVPITLATAPAIGEET